MKTQPLATISVCIPSYNGAQFIGEAIASILEQSFTDFELIIVDDCSADNTFDIVDSFQDARITTMRNPHRLGLVGNWNKCIELARGEYICIFHQDDVMLPGNLQLKVEQLRRNPHVGMIYSNVLQIGPGDELLSEWWHTKPHKSDQGAQAGTKFFKKMLLGVNQVCCPSVVARRECYERLGTFDQRLPYTADWEMWLRMSLFYDIAYLISPLIKYRRHDANETLKFTGVKELKHALNAKLLILEKYPEQIPDASELRSKVSRDIQQQALDQAFEAYQRRDVTNTKDYLSLAVEIQQDFNHSATNKQYTVWFLEIIDSLLRQEPHTQPATASYENAPAVSTQPIRYQPAFKAVIDEMTGRDIAENFPLRIIIKAIIHKLAAIPAFRWLYRFRNISHKILGI
jgi:glycosyltransferase involved in cell wall biosynthesis